MVSATSVRRVGVDLGGVVIDGIGSEIMFTPDYLDTPEVPGAVEAVARLHTAARVVIVSKCGPEVEARSRRWLAVHQFTERTGVGSQDWHFVRKRTDKGPLALTLALDAFIDDRQDVLAAMPPGVRRVHFGSSGCPDWPAALRLLLDDEPPAPTSNTWETT